MPRKRLYASDAERQSAYRDRQEKRRQAVSGPSAEEIAQSARDLHVALEYAAKAEGNTIAEALLGANAVETLAKVQKYLLESQKGHRRHGSGETKTR